MIESRLPRTVFKVGGSLFDLPDLSLRLAPLFFSSYYQSIVIFGGGPSVDDVREQSSRGLIDNIDAHWRAIDSMSRSAEAQSKTWPGMTLLKSIAELSGPTIGPIALDVAQDLRSDAGRTLPIGWEVTSDSIAAWLAHRVGATDLILVKSVGGPGDILIEDAHQRGWLDDHFPTVAADLIKTNCQLGWINARANPSERLGLRFSSLSGASDRVG